MHGRRSNAMPPSVPSRRVQLLEFDQIVRRLRTERHVEAALVLNDWLGEPDRDTAQALFVLLDELWRLLDGAQRESLTCDALAALWVTRPVAHDKYQQLLLLPE